MRKIQFLVLLVAMLGHSGFAETNISLSGGSWEKLSTPVLKVYTAEDGAATFRAYVIDWKGTEVVVSDRIATTHYREGEMIDVLAMKHTLPNGQQVLNFMVSSMPHADKVLAFKPFTGKVSRTSKTPSYVDCQPDCLLLYPSNIKVSWSELQQAGNSFERMLDGIQANAASEYLVVMVRPQSEKFYRLVRKMVGQRPIDVGYEAVDAEFKVDWDEAVKDLAVERSPPKVSAPSHQINMVPRAMPTNRTPVFLECRGNQLFIIDKENIDARVAAALASLGSSVRSNPQDFLRAMQAHPVTNEYYRVDPKYLMMAIVALDPKTEGAGETQQEIEKSDSRFQQFLSKKTPDDYYIAFLIRDDSFAIFRQARMIADKRGFETGWDLLGLDEPIKFGSGGMPR